MAVPDIGSIDYVKYTNVTRCFQIILKAAETSRTRIAEISRISKVTVSSCVDFLLDKKLICEVWLPGIPPGKKADADHCESQCRDSARHRGGRCLQQIYRHRFCWETAGRGTDPLRGR